MSTEAAGRPRGALGSPGSWLRGSGPPANRQGGGVLGKEGSQCKSRGLGLLGSARPGGAGAEEATGVSEGVCPAYANVLAGQRQKRKERGSRWLPWPRGPDRRSPTSLLSPAYSGSRLNLEVVEVTCLL